MSLHAAIFYGVIVSMTHIPFSAAVIFLNKFSNKCDGSVISLSFKEIIDQPTDQPTNEPTNQQMDTKGSKESYTSNNSVRKLSLFKL